MPWIGTDRKRRKKWPWRKVSWKVYKRILGIVPRRKPKPKPAPKPLNILMFDDVNVSLIPKDAQAVAGYVDGHYDTWKHVAKDFPRAKKVPIAVFGSDNGDALDVEPSDATVAQAAGWVKRQLATWGSDKHDVRLPVVYTSASWAAGLVAILSKAGLVKGKDYLLWTAHYDPSKGKHLCNSSCGFGITFVADATQFTDHALSRNLDESVTTAGFWA